jgi:carbon monoxide dehydrogenase subunit G
MEMSGEQLIPASQQETWDALNDPQVLKACVPGCEAIDHIADNEYQVQMVARVGPVSAKFKGRLTLSDIKPPSSYSIAFEGQGGPAGFAKGGAQVKLSPQNGGTKLAYDVKASVGGKLAQIGSRLVDAAAKKVADDFFRNFTLRLSPAGSEEDTVVAAGRIKPRSKAVSRVGEVERAPTRSDTSVMIFAAVALIAVIAGLILFLR